MGKWWPEQREDENCLKVIAYNQVRDGFKQGKMLKDTLEIEKALERADKEYRYFVNIGSNLHRENNARAVEHIVPEEAKRAATLLSKEVQEKIASGRWTLLDKLSNMDMPETPIHKN